MKKQNIDKKQVLESITKMVADEAIVRSYIQGKISIQTLTKKVSGLRNHYNYVFTNFDIKDYPIIQTVSLTSINIYSLSGIIKRLI